MKRFIPVCQLSRLLRAFGPAIRSNSSSESLLTILGDLLELPPGTEVFEITPSGASAWVQTVRIRTRQKDGTAKDYFKKVQRMFYNPDTYSNVVARVKSAAWVEE